jgi:hypothetical protein
MPAGLLKLASWESTIALFQDEYKVPLLRIYLVTGLELRSNAVRRSSHAMLRKRMILRPVRPQPVPECPPSSI